VAAALVLMASKVIIEASLFPLIEAGALTETGVVYGIEANLEEGGQLLGFGALFATFTQLMVDRMSALARGELLDEAEPTRGAVASLRAGAASSVSALRDVVTLRR
jgi:hypothetical protein